MKVKFYWGYPDLWSYGVKIEYTNSGYRYLDYHWGPFIFTFKLGKQ